MIIANDVRVYVFNPLPIVGGLGSAGHASIGIGAKYLSFHKGHLTTLAEDGNADNIFRLSSTSLNTTKMLSKLAEFEKQADQYDLFCKNCAYTVAAVLRSGGMDLGDIYSVLGGASTPYKLRDDLLAQFSSRPNFFVAVGCSGSTETSTLMKLLETQGYYLISKGSWALPWNRTAENHTVVSRHQSIGI